MTIMKTRNIQILIIGLILVSFLIGAYLYPYMPEKMASHWDANGRCKRLYARIMGPILAAGHIGHSLSGIHAHSKDRSPQGKYREVQRAF